ncbi:energy transducer TonB [candidate division CSSED10-310 bacterium]|uniref:Energy transducer TonB n=1 Tax=candidate division CSSED10-310 bacterium TaxID=2855610 RepID=A0ABV6YUN5_UNCC1
MFDSLIVSKTSKIQKVAVAFVIVSFTIHFIIIGYMALDAYLTIPEILTPAVTVTFINATAIAPPPPPRAPARKEKQKKEKPKVEKKEVEVPKLRELMVSSEIPDEISTEIEPEAPTLDDMISAGVEGGLEGDVLGGGFGVPDGLVSVPDEFRRFTSEMTRPSKIRAPAPLYPELAKQAGITCVVIVEAKIDTNGNVKDATILRSCPVFEEQFNAAVMDALAQWKFTPATLNGVPVAVRYTLTIKFTFKG